MPRLSVDIDLTYVPLDERAIALKNIDAAFGCCGATTRDSRRTNQFTWLGGVTGSGSGATGTPSSTSDFACSSVALP